VLEKGLQVRAVLFDFGGTLCAPQPAAVQVQRASRELGLGLTGTECERLAAELLKLGMPGGPYPDTVPPQLEQLYTSRDLGPEQHRAAYLGLMSGADAPAALIEAVYEQILGAAGWVPYSDAHRTLSSLAELGIAVGLVSNVGFDLRPILTAHGMSELAAQATLSYEHGVVKPEAQIFRLALENLGAAASGTLMVGDSETADGGASALGMRTLILPMSAAGGEHGLRRVLKLVRRAAGASGESS
jgi:HAD superfamily hydrolase (TIGR01549 family)